MTDDEIKAPYRNFPPIILRGIRGALGNEVVIKQYKYGTVITRFPRKSTKPRAAVQVKRQNMFKEAVAYAKSIYANSELKAQWKKRAKRNQSVFNAIVSWYMNREKKEKEKNEAIANRLLFKALHPKVNSGKCKRHHIKGGMRIVLNVQISGLFVTKDGGLFKWNRIVQSPELNKEHIPSSIVTDVFDTRVIHEAIPWEIGFSHN